MEAGDASPIPTLRKFPRAAVASDGQLRSCQNIYGNQSHYESGLPCATVAKELLAEGGSAVDAAVGALVCDGLYNPQVYSEYPGYIDD